LAQFDSGRTVLIFTDDVAWCRQQAIFNEPRFIILENSSAIVDLCLMTMCSDHIISNSAFSWWGAWLANAGKVIAPDQYSQLGSWMLVRGDTIEDLYPSNWIMVKAV
jgi:hypothetical protein